MDTPDAGQLAPGQEWTRSQNCIAFARLPLDDQDKLPDTVLTLPTCDVGSCSRLALLCLLSKHPIAPSLKAQPVSSFHWLHDKAAVVAVGHSLGVLRLQGDLGGALDDAKKTASTVSSLRADLVVLPRWHADSALPTATAGLPAGSAAETSQRTLPLWQARKNTQLTKVELNAANKDIVLTCGTDGRAFVTNLSSLTAVLASAKPYAVNGMFAASSVITGGGFRPGQPATALTCTVDGTLRWFDIRAKPNSTSTALQTKRAGMLSCTFVTEHALLTSFDDGSVSLMDLRSSCMHGVVRDRFMSCAESVAAHAETGVAVTFGDAGVSVWRAREVLQPDRPPSYTVRVAQRSHHRAKGGRIDTPNGYHTMGAFSDLQPGVCVAGDSLGNVLVLDTMSTGQSYCAAPADARACSSASVSHVESQPAAAPVLVATAKQLTSYQSHALQARSNFAPALTLQERVQAATAAARAAKRRRVSPDDDSGLTGQSKRPARALMTSVPTQMSSAVKFGVQGITPRLLSGVGALTPGMLAKGVATPTAAATQAAEVAAWEEALAAATSEHSSDNQAVPSAVIDLGAHVAEKGQAQRRGGAQTSAPADPHVPTPVSVVSQQPRTSAPGASTGTAGAPQVSTASGASILPTVPDWVFSPAASTRWQVEGHSLAVGDGAGLAGMHEGTRPQVASIPSAGSQSSSTLVHATGSGIPAWSSLATGSATSDIGMPGLWTPRMVHNTAPASGSAVFIASGTEEQDAVFAELSVHDGGVEKPTVRQSVATSGEQPAAKG